MPRRILARSTWHQAASAPSRMLPPRLFKAMTGVDFVHVPYSSSYLPDLLSGQVQAFSPIPTVREQIEAGKLRALAVTDAAPSSSLPGIPTLGEFVPGYEASAFIGVGAPRDTPTEIIDKPTMRLTLVSPTPRYRHDLLSLAACQLQCPASNSVNSSSNTRRNGEGSSARPALRRSDRPRCNHHDPSRASCLRLYGHGLALKFGQATESSHRVS